MSMTLVSPLLAADISGDYTADGRNPDGSRYSGSVTITSVGGDDYEFVWHIGKETFTGSGRLQGDSITVNWGQPDPVIYKVLSDGTLMGLWAKGRGTETLRRR
ncbi:MAG: hypothetical protein HY042_05735 [Spirochaetia bacterium]|nr:hypothetical protein [Spirochaetia bacterium]